MLVVISPAKTLDFETQARTTKQSQPAFLKDSAELIKHLQEYSPAELAKLMKLSDNLAALNVARFQTWQTPFTSKNAKQALLAFRGDVYQGLDADSLNPEDDRFAQKHLRILSGLYGVLKPLDLIQAYRLEMGSHLATPRGKDLYQFWGEKLTQHLNKELKEQSSKTLINLASNEYFRALQPQNLNAQVITPQFKDLKNGQFKVISFFAKKARGAMTRFIIQNRITDVEEIKGFKEMGYAYDAARSTATHWVFKRDTPVI